MDLKSLFKGLKYDILLETNISKNGPNNNGSRNICIGTASNPIGTLISRLQLSTHWWNLSTAMGNNYIISMHGNMYIIFWAGLLKLISSFWLGFETFFLMKIWNISLTIDIDNRYRFYILETIAIPWTWVVKKWLFSAIYLRTCPVIYDPIM